MTRLRLGVLSLAIACVTLCASVAQAAPSGQSGLILGPPTVTALLRSRIKSIFIIYQENRSFDSVFGTFPDAQGVWSPAARLHGFAQVDPVTGATITPFRISDPDVADADHSRPALIKRINDGRMDRYVALETKRALDRGASA